MRVLLARWTRPLVRRLDGDRYMQLMLIAFAGSVLGTRGFLGLTGFPQVGGGSLHISHALWGGLILFVAALLPLLLANRSVFIWSAILTGVGIGLFIDEVGKFITSSYNYFFPAAAPIAYGVFLLAVLVYLRARKPRDPDARAQLYAALELFTTALDRDLTPRQGRELEARLESAAERAPSKEFERLARGLLDLARPGVIGLATSEPGFLRRLAHRLDSTVDRWLTERRLRLGLGIGLLVFGAVALSDLATIVLIAIDLYAGVLSGVVDVANAFSRVKVTTTSGVVLLLVRAGLDVVVGVLLIIGGVRLLRDRPSSGLTFARVGLLLSLAVVTLLIFYFLQFAAAVSALVQFALLYGTGRYEDHYVEGREGEQDAHEATPKSDARPPSS